MNQIQEGLFAVHEFDYQGLVEKMDEAGIEHMADVLTSKDGLLALPSEGPKWKNEMTYFWKALFNAARTKDAVWLWLMSVPELRGLAPNTNFVFPQLVDDMELPEIGGPDDKPFERM